MDDRCLNDTELRQQYTGTEIEASIRRLLDATVSEMEAVPTTNVILFKKKLEPIYKKRTVPLCPECGKPMTYYGRTKIGDITFERFGCKDCPWQNILKKDADGQKEGDRCGRSEK